MTERPVYTVSQINSYVKSILEEDPILGSVMIRGEISNLKRHSSGHMYFSLKDEGSALSAAMFKWQCQQLRFVPENGMRVIASGRMTLYEPSGQYQMVVSALSPDGVGELYAAFERLKNKLESEGLFDQARKKPLPRYPAKVGVITSKTGAAVRDVLNILARRFPLAEVVLCPSDVQGAQAPVQLCRAIERLNSASACDVIIIGRGGGSIEDLWAFNSELLARTVAASHIPVVSAVGHETDFTICDYAADLRAPTPSAAAELVVPDRIELLDGVDGLRAACVNALRRKLDSLDARLNYCRMKSCFASPMYSIEQRVQMVDNACGRISNAFGHTVSDSRERLAACAARLTALNPLAVLSRGYCMSIRGMQVVSAAHEINPGDRLTLRYSDGTVNCLVEDKNDKRGNNAHEQ